MNLKELLKPIRFYKSTMADKNPIVTSLAMDSREVEQGTVFICIKGYTVDGHDFAEKAVEQGAVAIIAERPLPVSVPVIVVKDSRRVMAKVACHFYRYPTSDLQLIGVTGTNGKTTVTHLLERVLLAKRKKTGLIGTMYTKIGEETKETKNTTPESLPLQQIFHEMVHKKVDTAIMEVSSHALHLGRVHGCDFDIAVFTNLSPDHLDYHGSMEKYLYAKGLLFSQLGSAPTEKVAVINLDDPASKELIRLTAQDVITYGITSDADIRATNVVLMPNGTSFTLHAFEKQIPFQLKLIGKFSVYNVLATIAVGIAMNISISDMKESLEKVTGIAGRFEMIEADVDFSVIVDYAHTPDSLENVLETLKELSEKRIIAVVGCGGDRDKTKRPIMAQIATKYADKAIFTSDNPRSEDPKAILSDMVAGVNEGDYEEVIDRTEAIQYAIDCAKSGDIVLIAGKGHETYQIIGDNTIHFDDREVARKALHNKVW
ncbi:UDP-N-acetylmuramoyl-L-alanyl-D-glutamate--2,6-diaminopimelate ligase [Bacillus sp. JCM 19034]|uniref:UDP-N-acetylmuramoyl-L-alanyl-D-glutamate--2, 6-diaminopimelate ligase n=1 Tax=Bacillus sp. JCM 19034 TaxID=1481928 RepID=UPI0007814DBA|nr:UDP-N-acetylmuramoyl-L-alanyl-D-glutamate--2,6-diaminopimelate ligase [Bacillus sp. JCM 19034]